MALPLQNIVLDIDNTLVHSVSLNHALKEWTKDLSAIRIEPFMVFLRPHIASFLQYLFDNFNVGIFTAGVESYANDIVHHVILPNLRPDQRDRIQFVLHRKHYEECMAVTGKAKDLSYVENLYPTFDYFYTMILDDCDYVKDANGARCLQIQPFCVYNSAALGDGEVSSRLLRKWYNKEARRDSALCQIQCLLRLSQTEMDWNAYEVDTLTEEVTKFIDTLT